MSDTIRINGLKFAAMHGVRPEEKKLIQPFEVDVEIKCNLSSAAKTDRINETVDYSRIVSLVQEVMSGEQCNLLERLAGVILEKISTIVREGELIVRVRKPKAPLSVPFETVEVELRRTIGT